MECLIPAASRNWRHDAGFCGFRPILLDGFMGISVHHLAEFGGAASRLWPLMAWRGALPSGNACFWLGDLGAWPRV